MQELGHSQLAIVMPKYPHMMREDTEVWTKFLESDFIKMKGVWYDVKVGSSVLRNMDHTSLESRIADGLTRKRIDVVAAVGGGLWIIEVKPRANMYAIGQVVTYARLFAKEYSSPGEIVPVIICDSFDEDLLDEYDEFGVLVIQND